MNSSVETYQKRLRDELSVVEREIESYNQQIETLNKRLDGLKRALELCDSEESAVAELLRTGSGLPAGPGRAQKAAAVAAAQPKRTMTVAKKPAGAARPPLPAGKTAIGSRVAGNGSMKRVDMIAAVLRRHPRLTVRELIGALEREFRWRCGESNLTAHLYTNPDRFSHTRADRSGRQLVTWSVR